MERATPIRYLKTVGEKRSALFEKLGISTVGDLVSFYPRRYVNKGDIKKVADTENGELCSLIMRIDTKSKTAISRNGLNYITLLASDDTGSVSVTFFNQQWLEKSLVQGAKYRFYGKMVYSMFAKTMQSPEIEAVIEGKPLRAIFPIYPLTKGFAQRNIYNAINQITPYIKSIKDPVPAEVIEKYSLMNKAEAVEQIHLPENMEKLELARRRLAFEELLTFQLGIQNMRAKIKKENAIAMPLKGTNAGKFLSSLPFALTAAQERVIKEIYDDMEKSQPMIRLVQGDVGSGKTVVAAAAIYLAIRNGCQAAMMAPTEILARQHFETFSKLFEKFEIKIEYLTGSVTAANKKKLREQLENGEIDLIIGTHALIQQSVRFSKLGLIVADEQHRFGVSQRAMLADKSGEYSPHVLVMSATPIPRTLSLIMYGDLDLSVIDELPPGRQIIETYAVDDSYRNRVYNFIKNQVEAGRQAYIICPLVEDNEDNNLKSAEQHGADLAAMLPTLKIAVLHGKLSGRKKDEIMNKFSNGEIDVLVSTTVVEVGVDVPNATVMVVENAERFGLSQLHQLRGRVGRGKEKSYCVLIYEKESEKAKQRLNIMSSTNDGFEIARVDLEIRGPGELIGERQHGEIRFKIADIADMDMVNATKEEAEKICTEGLFGNEKYAELADEVNLMFRINNSENIFS
ncbi:MAG: ATP-dependent DNA helicase RecG [Clostridiales bacterium GWF2_38_85]|nr:MAG: ATP-dependent DNA helicase RecG [Clostridiales bacterium GWF2_38_85]